MRAWIWKPEKASQFFFPVSMTSFFLQSIMPYLSVNNYIQLFT